MLKAVDIWWAKWQASGREALVMWPRRKPVRVHRVLGEVEQAAVRQAVLDHRPCDPGPSGQLWTWRLVGELITKLYRVRLVEMRVGQVPEAVGAVVLAAGQAGRRAGHQGRGVLAPGDMAEGRAKAKAEGGEILFVDQVGIRSGQVTGRTRGERAGNPWCGGAGTGSP
ncbi:hypothetical protein [Streptomyces sp. ST2-7A]|uniref:hypothetical protein n=1 Tax=Streptomyces sp. ST2-7A TaxID=2907214 RepID=UPI001F30885D|nr:hypothetical protein [Streptomyces sp. ST2-7A]MCE7080105.1 hypothetical protein [Streptomyces sp. ST2-7A]